MNMNDLLESLYTKENSNNSLEKTAEAKLMSALNNSGETENPFMDLDLDTLVKIASEMEEDEQEVPSEFQESEMDMLGGQIMAHSCVHELGLMKQAMMNGLCRVCKTSPFDVEGSTVCSHCLEG